MQPLDAAGKRFVKTNSKLADSRLTTRNYRARGDDGRLDGRGMTAAVSRHATDTVSRCAGVRWFNELIGNADAEPATRRLAGGTFRIPLRFCLSVFCLFVIPAKAFARDYVITGVGLSVRLPVCLSVCYHVRREHGTINVYQQL